MSNLHAFVRRPGPRLAEGLVTHIERQTVDLNLARDQWDDYVAAMQSAGWQTIEVEAADDCPDAVFVEDTVVMYGDLAVITRPGAAERRAEVTGTHAAAEAAGYRVAQIEGPGTLDGGDVLKSGDTVWVGQGGRTNGEGIRQLSELLEPLGARVVTVPLTTVLHLKSAVTALPDGSVIGYPPLVDDPDVFDTFVAVPEAAGAHVVLLGEDTLLMAASAPATAALLRERGYRIVTVDIGEYEKLEGCVTCLSVRLRG